MNLRETVETCERCQALTPHSRRLVPLVPLLATLAALTGGALWLAGAVVRGALLLCAGLFAVVRDSRSPSRIACERCRGKRRAALHALRPTLDGNTEILL